MVDSILDDVKKLVGLSPADTTFDTDIILHVNTAFSTLTQLGIGPDDGFMIEDSTTKWVDYLGSNKQYNAVKSYVYLRVRMLFDPPTTSYAIEATKAAIQELEWRLNVVRESIAWVDPTIFPPQYETVLDGGSP